jgi:hypothetical protein
VECLAWHPEYADELEPLLLAAVDSPLPRGAEFTREAKRRARLRVMSEWDRRHLQRHRWSLASLRPRRSLSPRWAMAAAVLVIALALGGAGTVAAAQEAVPGNSLYPVKELREEAQLWFARSPEVKTSIYTNLVRERARELQALSGSGSEAETSVAVARLEQHLSAAHQLAPDAEGSTINTAAVDTALAATLQQALRQQDGSEDVLKSTLEDSPPELYPCLYHTYGIIQDARQQVAQALEGIESNYSALKFQSRNNGNPASRCPP